MGDCMWENGNILIICSLSIVNENISNICPFYLPRYTPKLGDWDPNLNQLEIFCMDNFGGFNHQEWKFVGIMGIWKISEKMAWRSVFVTTKYVDGYSETFSKHNDVWRYWKDLPIKMES
jgi:hypothetical protein